MSDMLSSLTQGIHRTKYRVGLLSMLALFLQCSLTGAKAGSGHQVATGIVFVETIETGKNPLVIHSLDIDLKAPGVRVQTGQALDRIEIEGKNTGREQISTLSARNHAFAAVNADFFPFTGDPLGLAIRNGELLSEPIGYRACIGFGPGGPSIEAPFFEGSCRIGGHSALRVDGINRLPGKNEIVVLSPSFHSTPLITRPLTVLTLAALPLPLRLGVPLHGTLTGVQTLRPKEHLPAVRNTEVLLIAEPALLASIASQLRSGVVCVMHFDLYANGAVEANGHYPAHKSAIKSPAPLALWRNFQNAVGGGPLLLKNGRIEIDSIAEDFDAATFVNQRHPRTAAGITAKGHLLLVVVDGRAPFSQGVSLPEMAAIMKNAGARDAINLDGGGSSTMVVNGSVVNAPSDGKERYVANGLLVYASAPTPPLPSGIQIKSSSKRGEMTAGESAVFELIDGAQHPLRQPVLWGTADGLGFVTQQGRFVSYHAGQGAISAALGTRHFTVPIRVRSAAPATLRCTLYTSGASDPHKAILLLSLGDPFGNPVSNQSVDLQVAGGSGPGHISTDAAGHARADLIWKEERARCRVRILVKGLPIQILRAQEARQLLSPSALPNDPDARP